MENTTTKNSTVKTIVESAAKFGFKPSSEFYNKVQINRKRWVLILNGKKEPTVTELQDICKYFGADIKEYI